MKPALIRVVSDMSKTLLLRRGTQRHGLRPLAAVQEMMRTEISEFKALRVELRTARLSLADAFDLSDAIGRVERNGVVVSVDTARLDLAHLLAISTATERTCQALAGPIRAELALGHLDLSKPLATLGLRIHAAVSGPAKPLAVLVSTDDLSSASQAGEALWVSATLNLVLRTIAERLGHEIRPGDVISTGAEALRLGLLTDVGHSEHSRSQSLPPRPCNPEIAVRRIRRSALAPEWGLRLALQDLVALGSTDTIAAVVIVLDVAGMSTSLADAWWSTVHQTARIKPVIVYAQLATSGALLPLVAGTQAVANPLARIGAAGAVAYEVDHTSIPLWKSVRAPAGDGRGPAPLKRRADIAAGLINARIADARDLDRAQDAQIRTGAIMTADEAYACNLVDCVAPVWTALCLARKLCSS